MEKNLTTFNKIFKSVSGQFTQLMIFLLLLFIFRPVEGEWFFHVIWQLLFAAVLTSAVFNCPHPRSVKILSVLLGVPCLISNWLSFFYELKWLFVLGHTTAMLFLVVCICSILHMVIIKARVTVETLRGAVCVYFMIGFFFALLYTNIQLFNEEAFHIASKTKYLYARSAFLNEMSYFSFVTLLSIGYGDVVPVAYYAQTFSILEGVVGHFYLAILVARLVAVYSFRAEKNLLLKHFEKKANAKKD